MRNFWLALFLAASLAVALPLAASAVGLDVELTEGGGLGLGSTTDPNATGSVRMAAQWGINLDLFLVSVGPADIGLSSGVSYTFQRYHGLTTVNALGPTSDQTSDTNYDYLNIPIAVVARVPLTQGLAVNLRAGWFFGYFVSGSTTDTYSNPAYFALAGTFPLDSNTNFQWSYGPHVSAGADIALGGNVSLSPSVIFDWGLPNVTQSSFLYSYSDTRGIITLNLGIKVRVF